MATVTANPEVQTEKKPSFTLSVQYTKADGSWASATSEREFTIPEDRAKITVAYTDDQGKQQTVDRLFDRLIVKSVDEALQLLNENPYLYMAATNYGLDLFYRNTVKGPIATEIEGPGKALAKLADQIMASRAKLGKVISKERAFELAKQMAELE